MIPAPLTLVLCLRSCLSLYEARILPHLPLNAIGATVRLTVHCSRAMKRAIFKTEIPANTPVECVPSPRRCLRRALVFSVSPADVHHQHLPDSPMGGHARRRGGQDVARERKTREAELCAFQGRPPVRRGRAQSLRQLFLSSSAMDNLRPGKSGASKPTMKYSTVREVFAASHLTSLETLLGVGPHMPCQRQAAGCRATTINSAAYVDFLWDCAHSIFAAAVACMACNKTPEAWLFVIQLSWRVCGLLAVSFVATRARADFIDVGDVTTPLCSTRLIDSIVMPNFACLSR